MKGVPFFSRRYTKGVPFSWKIVYKRVTGWTSDRASWYKHLLSTSPPPGGELKQHRWRRLRKRHLKSEVALLQTLDRLFHLVQFVKCWQFLLKLNSNRIQRKKINSLLCVHDLHKTRYGAFSNCSRSVTVKKCTKRCDAYAETLFANLKPIV